MKISIRNATSVARYFRTCPYYWWRCFQGKTIPNLSVNWKSLRYSWRTSIEIWWFDSRPGRALSAFYRVSFFFWIYAFLSGKKPFFWQLLPITINNVPLFSLKYMFMSLWGMYTSLEDFSIFSRRLQ